ncbi:MAG: hypothetical protein IID44_30735 [Planctomycetes bacterium]|nr:hypothetical protein [Planctomycetota bacterium]
MPMEKSSKSSRQKFSFPLPELPSMGYGWFLEDIDGIAYFFNDPDGSLRGWEIWTSDGTPEGTHIIKDILFDFTTALFSLSHAFVEFNGFVYFMADDGINGLELWRTDGTDAGTELFADLEPGPEGSGTTELKPSDERLFVMGSSFSLWVLEASDSQADEILELTLSRGFAPSLENIGGVAYFVNSHPLLGLEPWISDGTHEGTILLKDIVPGLGSSTSNPEFTGFDGFVYFFADDGILGTELWRSDGTEDGTVLVADLIPGEEGTINPSLHASEDRLFISASDQFGEGHLWVIESTP